jgi:hypothetical protein
MSALLHVGSRPAWRPWPIRRCLARLHVMPDRTIGQRGYDRSDMCWLNARLPAQQPGRQFGNELSDFHGHLPRAHPRSCIRAGSASPHLTLTFAFDFFGVLKPL